MYCIYSRIYKKNTKDLEFVKDVSKSFFKFLLTRQLSRNVYFFKGVWGPQAKKSFIGYFLLFL